MNDTASVLRERLVARLSEWMKISADAAASMFDGTATARTLANASSNLRHQTEEYVFSCLQEELAGDDVADDDFERPEEAPEGCFVRCH